MYSPASPLDGASQARQAQALAFLLGRGVERAKAAELVGAYWSRCAAAGLDPVLAVAQSVHETTDVRTGEPFASWWASPPRHNLAGIGVTGETRAHRADGAPDWQPGEDGRDRRGYAFASYAAGVLAHVVHLAAYRYAAGQEPPAIRPHLTASDDPRLPALVSAGRRGSARVLQDLDGKWAVPGLGYGASIAALANAIRATVSADGETSTGTGGGIMAICDRVQLIPPTNPNRLGRNLAGGKATGIAIHNTANRNRGANAAMHARFVGDPATHGGAELTSYHAVADDHETVQLLPFDEVGFHIGDGDNGPGNSTTLGIEICENSDGDFVKACHNAARVVAGWMQAFGIPLDEVHQHRSFASPAFPEVHSGCPAHLISGDLGVTWEGFKTMVSQAASKDPAQAEASALKAEAEAGVPALFRGALAREGEVDLTAFGGGAHERLAVYDKQRFHRLKGRTFAFLVAGPSSFEALFAAGKVVLF